MHKLNYNIITKNHMKKIYDYLENESNDNLIVLKKSRKIPEVGDVFVLSLKAGEYYYGKVLESFESNELKRQVIVIFAKTINEIDINKCVFDYKKLLFPPEIVYDGYWKKGFFKKIANIPLSKEEKNLDYGFFRMHPLKKYGYFANSRGEELDHFPKLYNAYRISNIYNIYVSIQIENLFLDKS